VTRIALTSEFVRRDLRERFSGSFAGIFWAVFQPALQLGIYAFVFVKVFHAKVPGADSPGYLSFLAVALWPWNAFSDATLQATRTLQDNAALIGKVAVPRALLVFARVCASFFIQMLGFIVIVIVLSFWDAHIRLTTGLLPALLLYLPLFALTLGFSFAFAALQVFVRDLIQLLGQSLPLLMYCAPVFFDRSILPVSFQPWLSLNPFTFYAEGFRALVLGHGSITWMGVIAAVAVSLVALLAGLALFRRLDRHFEDFL